MVSRLAALALAVLGACSEGARTRSPERALGSAAALVNGEAIELGEVQRLCAATGLAPEVALSRLVGERLLAQYAEARGYAAFPAVQRAATQTEVQALLAQEIENGSPADDVEGRARRLTRLLDALARRTTVRYDEAAIRRAFAR